MAGEKKLVSSPVAHVHARVFVKLTKDHHRTFGLKLGDYFCPLVIPEFFYAVNTEGVLDFEEAGPRDDPHIHEIKKQRYFGIVVS